MSYRIGILTVSDKGSRGERQDLSGDELEKLVLEQGWEVTRRDIVPDDAEAIKLKLIDYCDHEGVNLVLTTGGTGLSPRDITPDVTRQLFTRDAPGFAEAMRAASMAITPHAMLSRAASGIRGCSPHRQPAGRSQKRGAGEPSRGHPAHALPTAWPMALRRRPCRQRENGRP